MYVILKVINDQYTGDNQYHSDYGRWNRMLFEADCADNDED